MAKLTGAGALAFVLFALPCQAGQVEVLAAEFARESDGAWNVSVTLEHDDTGWEHYADAWRVVAPDGTVLGTRTLYHPHETEQPFTRSLGGVRVPSGVDQVSIEAHDKVHGWAPTRLNVDLSKASDGRVRARR